MVQAKKFLRTNNKPPSDAANDDSSSMAGNKDGDFDEENMSGDENNANSEIEVTGTENEFLWVNKNVFAICSLY